MRTTVCLLAIGLVACTDETSVNDPLEPNERSIAPHVCEVLEPDRDNIDRSRPTFSDSVLRLPGPRQPRGGMMEPTTPPAPNDPRDYCELTNRCQMRAVSDGREWHGAVQDGELVVGYADDAGTLHTTVVDAVEPGAKVAMSLEGDRVLVEIAERVAIRGYRICVDR
jgi:hypothetical protein